MKTKKNIYPIYSKKTKVTPERSKFNRENLITLNNFFLNLINEKKLQSAAYIISRHGKIFAHTSMGKLSWLNKKNNFNPDSLRKIASITKLITAIAIMQLIEQGKIYLQQPVHSIIKQFDRPDYDKINIFHLLTHSSGIIAEPGYYNEPEPDFKLWESLSGKENWIESIINKKTIPKTGQAWEYSSFGFMILGEIIRLVSGKTYSDYIFKNIITPLGMKNTYASVPEKYFNNVSLLNEKELHKLKKSSKQADDITLPCGGISEGLYSTLEDVWKLGQLILNKGTFNKKRILGRKSVEMMTRMQINLPAYCWGENHKNWKYGLGIDITDTNSSIISPGTLNIIGSGRAALFIDPTEDLVLCFFIPSELQNIPEPVTTPVNIIWSGIL